MGAFDPNYKEKNLVVAKICQKILIFNKKGEVLFLQRSEKSSRPHEWDLVGGGLDRGETVEEGLRREVWEECQLKIKNITPVYVQLEQSGDDGSYVLMVGYKGDSDEDSPIPILSWEHESYKWVTREEALGVKLPEFHSKLVVNAVNG